MKIKYLLLLLLPVCINGQSININEVPTTPINSLEITGNNALSLTGDATVWDDLTFPATQLKAIGANNKPDFIIAHLTFSFPEDTTEAIGFLAQMPHNWKVGSRIFPHVHWRQEQNQSVDWRIAYRWWDIGELVPAQYSYHVMSTMTQPYTSGTLQQLSTNLSGISGEGHTLSSELLVVFYRKSDNYTGEAEMIQVDIHYEINKLGSRTETAE